MNNHCTPWDGSDFLKSILRRRVGNQYFALGMEDSEDAPAGEGEEAERNSEGMGNRSQT